MADPFTVRVMVPEVWDEVVLPVEPTTTVASIKDEALRRARVRVDANSGGRVVKYRGAAVLDESVTLQALGAPPNAPFIVLARRRQPVR